MTIQEKASIIADILDALQNSNYLAYVIWKGRPKNSFDPPPPKFDRGNTFFDLVFLEDQHLLTIAKECKVR